MFQSKVTSFAPNSSLVINRGN